MRRLPVLAIVALCVLTVSSVVAQSPPLTPFRGLIDHVSVDQWGNVPTENVEIWHRAISGDGRYVVMSTRNPYLATGEYNDNNGYDDVFLRDRMSGWTWRISRPIFGGSADGISQMATISTNGRHIAFASGATNLVPGDTNGRWDVFVRDHGSAAPGARQRCNRRDAGRPRRLLSVDQRRRPVRRVSLVVDHVCIGRLVVGAPADVSARSRRRWRRVVRRAG